MLLVSESGFGLGVFPKPIYRDKGLGEFWHAANTPDDEFALLAILVTRKDGKVANASNATSDAVDARHGFTRGALVD